MNVRMLPIAIGLLFAAACPAPEPYYDDEMGLEAIPVEAGALAGTFALKMQITTVTNLPLIGEVVGGGDTYLLVERSWDGSAYSQTQEVCDGVINSETSTSTLPIESWQAVPATSPRTLDIVDDEGRFLLEGHYELWGLELEDPYGDDLPADDVEAQEPPHVDRVVDMDDDGNPGMTINVDGLVSGDFYFVQRKVSDLEGVILGPDRVVTLNRTAFEQTIVGAASGVVQQGYPQEAHEDPLLSWAEEIRLADGSGCDAVIDAVENEDLSRFPPF